MRPGMLFLYLKLNWKLIAGKATAAMKKWAIQAWKNGCEQYLAGKHGASLYVVDPRGQIAHVWLKPTPSHHSQSTLH